MSTVVDKTFFRMMSEDFPRLSEDLPKLKAEADRLSSRATSVDDDTVDARERQMAAMTRDSLPSAWGISDSDKDAEDESDKEQMTHTKTDSSESESEGQDQTSQDDAAFLAMAGVWWGSAGERYNVEKTARGTWRCVRRGPNLGQQKVYPLSREAEFGRLLCGDSFVLDHVLDGHATWHSLKARISGAKGRKFAWSRSKPVDKATPVLPAAAAEPAEEPTEVSTSYSRSLMLAVRLSLAKAEDLPQGQEPLGISANSFRAPPGLELPVETETEPESPAAESSEAVTPSAPTTVMLRNLPNQCTRGMLTKWLSTTAFSNDFDLVYVPVDRTSGNNLGYAFINFIEAASCELFSKAIHGTKAAKCFPGSRSSKVLHVCIAKVQGKEPYCQAIMNASKSSASNSDSSAEEPAAPQPSGSSACGLRAEAPDFTPMAGAWCPTVEEAKAESADAEAESATAEADEREEPASEPAMPSFQGMRAEAPDFVPAASITNTDDFLQALIGMPVAEHMAQSHAAAAARAKRFSSQLFVPPAAAPEQ